jgi:hypothetical protein
MKKKPAAASTIRIPTFAATIAFSDLPTAFAPMKLMAVKTTITAVAKMFIYIRGALAGKKVIA